MLITTMNCKKKIVIIFINDFQDFKPQKKKKQAEIALISLEMHV